MVGLGNDHMHKNLPKKMANPRDTAGNAEEEEEITGSGFSSSTAIALR